MTGITSQQIRAELTHPVIDGDGHAIEIMPLLFDYLKQVAGTEMYEMFVASRVQPLLGRGRRDRWYHLSPAERADQRMTRPSFWVGTGNTYDRMTAMLPDLRRARMDELGIDYSIIYPTGGLEFALEENDELRRALCRAANMMSADLYREHAERMTPAAIVPMHTPEEAVEELEYAVEVLGLKAMYIPAQVRRPVPIVARQASQVKPYALWLDLIALDSVHDYDPLWKRCVELGVAPTSHSGGMGWGSRTSISNYMFNHIGHFAAAGEGFCKALFFGGVTRRFPTLRFGFLEGGAAWARTLYDDIVGHWEKRNLQALLANLNPENLDIDQMRDLFKRYGGQILRGRETEIEAMLTGMRRHLEDFNRIDDFSACGLETKEDIPARFVEQFYFGCEADDPGTVAAFRGQPRLRAIFSSDIGHWDVPDIRSCLEEAYELAEHGAMTFDDFRDFVFSNPLRLHMGMNPRFFDGTVVAAAARKAVADGDVTLPAR